MADDKEGPRIDEMDPGVQWYLHALFAAALAGLVLSIWWFGKNRQPTEMGIAVAACGFCIVIANLHRLRSLSIGKVQLEVQRARRATKQAEEAAAKLGQLQRLAIATARATFNSNAGAGLWGGFRESDRFEILEDLTEVLRNLAVSEREISRARSSFDAMMCVRHALRIKNAALKALASEPDQKVFEAVLASHINFDERRGSRAKVFRELLQKRGIMTPEVDRTVREYEHYEAHGTLLYPQMWESVDA